ncbi:MAG: PEP-CTERM sorting domain-containing protein [Terriglobia bacterium]
MKKLFVAGVMCLTLAGLSVPQAHAGPYTVTLTQQGRNVVANGSGFIDLSGLTFNAEYSSASAALWPSNGYVNTGPTSSVPLDGYTGFTGPTSFGSGGGTSASSGSGASVEIWGSPVQYGVSLLWVPSGYVSDNLLSDTSTYDNATFASLGVTPGTYVWTWGMGANQSFTLDVPEPSSLALLGAGLLGLVFLRRRKAA